MFTLATIGALHLLDGFWAFRKAAPNQYWFTDYQVFGIRPRPRVVVAGAEAGDRPIAT
jgi:hypothetical protein